MKNLVQKLVLGTAQFGLDYGINNSNGKPSRKKSLEMLDFAYEKGIRIFDTAYAYGDAEEILGEFSISHNLGGKIRIITKTKGEIGDVIIANLKESLSRLKSDYVDGCLLHAPELIKDDKIVNILCNFKKEGLVKNIGFSIDETEDAIYAAKLKETNYIQVPYNIFDQRLDKTDFFRIAKKNGITVFARSAFLQGLFLMPEDKIPSYLENAKGYLQDLDEIIGKYGLTRMQAALLFSLSNENINHVVFGVDNINQLIEIMDFAENFSECSDCVRELKNKFIEIEKNIIFPDLWKK